MPVKPDRWIKRARQAAEILAEDATVKGRENKTPLAEIILLKSSGLTRVLGPARYGGGEQSWEGGYKVIVKPRKRMDPPGCSSAITCSGLGSTTFWEPMSRRSKLRSSSPRITVLWEV